LVQLELFAIKLELSDSDILHPEVGGEDKESDIAKADSGVAKGLDVDWWEGSDELVLEGFVAIMV
jgi:hypothetical protein